MEESDSESLDNTCNFEDVCSTHAHVGLDPLVLHMTVQEILERLSVVKNVLGIQVQQPDTLGWSERSQFCKKLTLLYVGTHANVYKCMLF